MKRISVCIISLLFLFLLGAGPTWANDGAIEFCNTTNIDIPQGQPGNTEGPADPYPSEIAVSGLSGQVVDNLTVRLNGLSHTYPDDIIVLLVGPEGQNIMLMSAAGGSFDINDVTLTFDDAADSMLPDNAQIASGTYKPTNYYNVNLPGAPATSGATTLDTFSGTDPNGTWSLYVYDRAFVDSGAMAGGWCLSLTAFTPVDIDIKPGSYPNSISPKDKGLLSVAILSTPDFDATQVDPSTITLGGEPVATRNNGTLMASIEDVDGDGYLDLVVKFDIESMWANGDLELCTGELILNGQTFDGIHIRGSDSVKIAGLKLYTETFANTDSIAIPGSGTSGPADPYPSDITVSSVLGKVVSATVTLNGLSHTYPDDIIVLLVGPEGQNIMLMSAAGGSFDINDVTLTFDDAADSMLPDNAQIASGTYKPTNYYNVNLPGAPPTSTATNLDTFRCTDPNGTWSLYVYDRFGGDVGSIAGGWSLTINSY